MTRTRKWLVGVAAGLAFLGAANIGLSRLVGSHKITRLLTERLEATFGRPVQVGRFDFSIWGGPRIEADSVTVAEDPRFGNEYFLRAGQLTATLRLRALLRGRVDFGSFSISQASLNIVTVGGRWNLADWLPPASPGPAGKQSGAPRLYSIAIDNGRINFKRGIIKLPFALVNVNGRVDETAPGRWSLSLDAQPFRAAVTLQDAGTIRLAGQIGGTSARLRPADLSLSWQDASISDVLRLFFGYDYDVRGRQDLNLQASSSGEEWRFKLDARASELHRWDFVAQRGNPAVNVQLAGAWSPDQGKLTLTKGEIEGPSSLVAVSGGLNWPVKSLENPGKTVIIPRLQICLSSEGIGVQDLLSWYRSFHQGVPAGLQATGWLDGSADIAGWPPRVQQASISATQLSVKGGDLRVPVKLATARLQASKKAVAISLSDLDLGSKAGRFQIIGHALGGRRWKYRLEADGSSAEIRDLLDTVEALGVSVPVYWREFSGGATIKIDWAGTIPFSQATRTATIDLHNAIWQEPSLPARVRLVSARITASGDHLRFQIGSAEALGASWHGQLERPLPSGTWQFALAANQLNVHTLLARFRPKEHQPNLLERIFGFGHAAGSPPLWPASLDASGTIDVDRLSLAPLSLNRLRGRVTIHNGTLELSPAEARLYGGQVRGSLSFSGDKGIPAWRLESRADRVELGRLSQAFSRSQTAGRFSGLASGTFHLLARGATAVSLRDSLQGQALISIRDARDTKTDWLATLQAGHAVAGRSSFARCSAQIRLGAGKLTLQSLAAVSRRGRLEATGGIDLVHGGKLTVEARFFPSFGLRPSGSTLEAGTYEVTGSSADPLIRFLPPAEAAKSSDPPR